MAELPELAFKTPPIAEVGLTVMTEGGLMDNYDVRGLHSLFAGEFPTVSRQSAIDIFAQPELSELLPSEPIFRWWFTSANQARLLQFQENMIASNWRRIKIFPDLAEPYPGYDALNAAFRKQADLVAEYAKAQARAFPKPVGCELFYDNHFLMLQEDGSRRRIHDVLRFFQFQTAYPMTGLQTIWVEGIEINGVRAGDLIVRSALGGAEAPDSPPLPIVRLMLSARFKHDTWEGIFERFDVAHTYIRKRFVELTTDESRATWGVS